MRSALGSSLLDYEHVNTVVVQGTTVVLAREAPNAPVQEAGSETIESTISFNVLSAPTDGSGTAPEWVGFRKLAFPNEVRPVGMEIVNVLTSYGDDQYLTPVTDAGGRFRAIAFGEFVYVFRRSTDGTLLSTRFRLIREGSTATPDRVSFSLEPSWEVRFQISEKPDVPTNDQDVQNYLSLSKEPFYEPTFDLSMVRGLTTDAFDVEIVPVAGGRAMCHVFQLLPTDSKVRVFSLPIDESGRFDLEGVSLDAQGVAPSQEFAVQLDNGAAITLFGSPSAELYLKQESVSTDRQSFYIKRTGRVMLACSTNVKDAGATLITLDFALTPEGQLAKLPPIVKSGAVGAAPYTGVFNATTYIALKPVDLPATFNFSMQLLPTDAGDEKQIIIQDRANPRSFWLELLPTNQIEIGIGTGENQSVFRTTDSLKMDVWSELELRFDPAASSPCRVFVNNNEIVVEGAVKGTPAAKIDALGSATTGYVGQLDNFYLHEGVTPKAGKLLIGLPLDDIDYSAQPPTTPNTAPGSSAAEVFGVYLTPSTSPMATANLGTEYYDGLLTSYAAYFEGFSEYDELRSAPYLMEGSDGLIHCYFQGKNDQFCVLQYDTRTARAAFMSEWKTVTGAADTGPIQFLASKSGTSLNHTEIRVEDGVQSAFCNITIVSPTGPKEQWTGVPRQIDALAATVNGTAVQNPADPRLLNAAASFFDPTGTYHGAYLTVRQSPTAAALGFVDRYPADLALTKIALADSGEGLVTATIEFSVPRWSGTYTQVWPNLPKAAPHLVQIFSGNASGYDYGQSAGFTLKSYSLIADSVLVSNSRVVIFVEPKVEKVDVLRVDTVEEEPLLCNVAVELTHEGKELVAAWSVVSRAQDAFAAVIQGLDKDYDYEANASGDYKEIQKLLLVLTDGMSATVSNSDAVPTPDQGMLVGAGVFVAFPTAAVRDTDEMAAATGTATAFQRATIQDDGVTETLTTGSKLLRAFLTNRPTTGGAAWAQNTSDLTGGTAVLVTQGVNGGWVQEPNRRTLAYQFDASGSNWVNFSVDSNVAPNIDRLTIAGDLSVEMWCKPTAWSSNAPATRQRLLTFSRPQAPDLGDANVQYLAGLRQCPSLKCTPDTTIRTSISSGGTGTFVGWISPKDATQKAWSAIASFATLGIVQPILSIGLNTENKLELTCPISGSKDAISAATVLSPDKWYQVAFSLQTEVTEGPSGYQYKFHCVLYLNGKACGSHTFTHTSLDELQLATLVLGDVVNKTSLNMSVNEVAFVAEVLSAEDVDRYANESIPNNLGSLILKWSLTEGTGSLARNSAASGRVNDGKILPQGQWFESGLFSLPMLGYGERIGLLKDTPLIPGWSHLAMVRQAGYALQVDGRQYADCGADTTLQVGDAFSIEAWVQLDALRPEGQVILAKGDDYRLYVGPDGRPAFDIQVSIDDVAQVKTAKSSTPIKANVPYYFAVTYTTTTVSVQGTGEQKENAYEIHLDLYQNGVVVAKQVGTGAFDKFQYERFKTPINCVSSTAPFNIGRTSNFGGALYTKGYIGDVRVWNRVLTADEILKVANTRHKPANTNGLISWWRFEDSRGKVVLDQVGNNHASLSLGARTVLFEPTSVMDFYVNGKQITSLSYLNGASLAGGYGDNPQFYLGFVSGGPKSGFAGQLDEVRIWNGQRTQLQIADNMNRSLSGSEKYLAGYWRFDNGSGVSVEDVTGRGNTGTLGGANGRLPAWMASTAPISNEAGPVYNALGGVPTTMNESIQGLPGVVEYAGLERDAYGSVYSVMKRLYAFVHQDKLQLLTGYNVGDLDTIYMGQAQAAPSLVGFIEGAPPIPSENQTLPYWTEGPSALNSYAGATSVKFQEATSVSYAYNVDRSTASLNTIDVKAGLKLDGAWKASVGLVAEVESPVFKIEGKLGGQAHFEFGALSGETANSQTGTSRTLTSELQPGGSWEPGTTPDQWLNATVGRRYSPTNTGYALVKSLTVDLYASVLKSTGTMVAINSIPNPDIPADVNIIDFPIDPSYVKNGTLDGKVGLVNDPLFQGTDQRRGSYFKPVEAYALKRDIERKEKQLEANFLQYNVADKANRLSNPNQWSDYKTSIQSGASYDWAKHLAKRNLVNTYVWTASGGRYAEEETAMNVYSESYRNVATNVKGGGAALELGMVIPVAGFYLEFDYLYTSTTEVSVVKQKDQSAGFSLSSTASPDAYLMPPVIQDGTATYGSQPAEGKVDGYRYMSFFVAPSRENFDAFKRIIDPNWYHTSSQPNAIALREASTAENGVWRVLHRVTFVSRIPSQFQPVPDTSPQIKEAKPVGLARNATIVELIRNSIQTKTPTPLEVGSAVIALLGTPDNPGTLTKVVPWWPQFLNDSKNPRLPAARILRSLREDLLDYMVADYATRQS